jgi:hypothetical protein
MRNHILVSGLAALALIAGNTLPTLAKSEPALAGENTAKSARHVDYRLIGSYTGKTHDQHLRVFAGKTDDGGGGR